MRKSNDILGNVVAHEVSSTHDVLGILEGDVIVGKINSGFGICEHGGRTGSKNTKNMQQFTEVDSLLKSKCRTT